MPTRNPKEFYRRWLPKSKWLSLLLETQEDQISSISCLCGMNLNNVIVIAHLSVILYIICFFIQAGTLSYLSARVGLDVTAFGYLQGLISAVQLCSSFMFGRFGDIYGSRAAMLLALAPATASYAVIALSYVFPFMHVYFSVPLMLISMVPNVFRHAMLAGQMVVTDLSTSQERTDALGKLGMSHGVGLVLGPYIGLAVKRNLGVQVAPFVSCIGMQLTMLMVYYNMPHKIKNRLPDTGSTRSDSEAAAVGFDIKNIITMLKDHPQIFVLLIVKLVTSGLPLGLWRNIMGMVALQSCGLNISERNELIYVLDIFGLMIQGLGIGLLAKYFEETKLIKWSSFALIWSWLFMASVHSWWQLTVALMLKYFGLITLNILICSGLTKLVPAKNTGTMLGINLALEAVIHAFSPCVAGLMHECGNFTVLASLPSIIVTGLLFFYLKE